MNKQKGFSPIIILIIIVLIGGGFFAWKYYFQAKGQSGTYIKEECGFEINYPSGWYAYEYQRENIISTFSKNEYGKFYGTTEIAKLGESIGVIWMSCSNTSLENNLKSIQEWEEVLRKPGSSLQLENFFTEEVAIGGINGYRIYYNGRSFMRFEEGEEAVYILYLFPTKGGQGTIEFEGNFKGKNNEEYKKNFEQIISTFKFLD